MTYKIVSDAFKNLSTNLKMRLKSSPQSFIITGEIQPRDLKYITSKLASQFSDELQDTLVISQQDGKHSNDLVHLLSELEDEPFQTLLSRSIFAKDPLEDQNTLLKLIKQHLFQSEQKFDQLFFTLDSLPELETHQQTLQKLMRCLIKQFDRIIISIEPGLLEKIHGFFPFIHGSLLVTPVDSLHKHVAKSIRNIHRRAPVLGLVFWCPFLSDI
jgi:hypothetical protein